VLKLQGATPAQLTALNVDKTSLLQQAAARYQQPPSTGDSSTGGSTAQPAQHGEAVRGLEVVGELQFAFIAFVFGQSLEGGCVDYSRLCPGIPKSCRCACEHLCSVARSALNA
jgi:hypothetical protein